MSEEASVGRLVGQIQGALSPLVVQVENLGERMNNLIGDTNRRHEENITSHARDKADLRECISQSAAGLKSSSESAIATLQARMNERFEPLEFDFRMRTGRIKSKRALLAKAGIIAAIGAALHSSWGAIKGALVWLLNWHG